MQNTRIGFGNTADRHVQSQPYILIKRREMTDALRERARRFGCAEWQSIKEDTDEQLMDAYKDTGEKTTVILRLWKDDKTGTVWGCECARGVMIRKPWDLGLRLYPVTWLCWDYVQDSYHGQALITGLIPNQIYINKLFAMSMISLMATAYPKIVYDKTRIPRWDNGIGRAIGVNGGGVDNVARVLGPAQISPQIAQFIELTQSLTQTNLGATSVALGEAKPDNTSAIIALQRAAATPNEITQPEPLPEHRGPRRHIHGLHVRLLRPAPSRRSTLRPKSPPSCWTSWATPCRGARTGRSPCSSTSPACAACRSGSSSTSARPPTGAR